MKRFPALGALMLWCVLALTPLGAHHAGSEYDRTTIEIQGQLPAVAWQ